MPDKQGKERRREPRHDVSMPVWWQDPAQAGVRRGWMLNVSGHGAALLASEETCPAVGDRLDVSLIDPELGLGADVARYLLHRATTCRLDPVTPSMNRVALHFDDDLWVQDREPLWQGLADLVADRDASPNDEPTSSH